MDNRKNPFLSEFFSKLKLYQMKTSKLHNLTFHSKFYNISHIYTIISPNLTSLSIGTLDKDTFTNLLLYITSSEYSSISNLITLQISLNNNITNYDSISDLFYLLFTEYPKSLKEIIIISYIKIDFKKLSDLIDINNYNSLIIEHYKNYNKKLIKILCVIIFFMELKNLHLINVKKRYL